MAQAGAPTSLASGPCLLLPLKAGLHRGSTPGFPGLHALGNVPSGSRSTLLCVQKWDQELERPLPLCFSFSIPKEDADSPITVDTGQTAMGPASTTELGSG